MSEPAWDERRISFTPLLDQDLPLVQRWLNTEHVMRWWGRPGPTLDEVREKYGPRIRGDEPIDCYLMRYDSRPIGHIQSYFITDFEEYGLQEPKDDTTAGVDLFVGEAEYLGRGLGSLMLRRFVDDVVFGRMQARRCMIDPSINNLAAIRAYEKAGFRRLYTYQRPFEHDPVHIMAVVSSQ